MFGRAELSLGKSKMIIVSDRAVVKQNGTNDKYVYVVKPDNTVEYRKVELGKRMESKYAVIAGLSEGEKVVISDYTKLKNGTKVKIQNNK